MTRQTHTYVLLDVPQAHDDSIAERLRDAGYGQVFHRQSDGRPAIDMQGIVLCVTATTFPSKDDERQTDAHALPLPSPPSFEQYFHDDMSIDQCLGVALRVAHVTQQTVSTHFAGHAIVVRPGDAYAELMRAWMYGDTMRFPMLPAGNA